MHRSLPLIHLTHHEREGKQFLERPSLDVQRRKRIGAEGLLLDPVLTYFGGCCCRRVAAGDTVNVRSLQSSGSSGGAAAKQSCSRNAVVGGGEESDTKLLDKWNSLTGLSAALACIACTQFRQRNIPVPSAISVARPQLYSSLVFTFACLRVSTLPSRTRQRVMAIKDSALPCCAILTALICNAVYSSLGSPRCTYAWSYDGRWRASLVRVGNVTSHAW